MTQTGTDGEWDGLKEEVKPKQEEVKPKPKAFYPQGNRVLVEVLPPDTVTDGGVMLPETAKVIVNIGRVIEIGPGVFKDGILVPVLAKHVGTSLVPGIRPGDLVHLNCVVTEVIQGNKKYLATNYHEITIGGKECLLMKEEDILCRIV